ncbi:DUF4251 domain-containing protein [Flavobacterium gilvum]|uniref:DUF4251 domain-containing protein n=1 Tax=Flavobacterium gilvum TaxID=1492737 RepID=A0AAC9I3W6_9FLAO|nr:DUF4251 domain-containing protein [Flavobacterium gilvum]AOW09841.1 hypothetical protein EM308_10170 [Flavobacterium gilvum]KFC58065.1 hypothetical protein FEM08_31330 [Flavobacterium gilvum]
MKTVVLSLFLSFSMLMGFAQEKTKKQIKEEQNLAKQKKMEALIEAKNYEFVADWAYPQGGRSINMTSNPNYFRIKKDSVHSEMPFFGRAYSGVAYSSNGGGLDFKGEMRNYILEKNKKDFTIKTEVKGQSDNYSIILIIYFDGGASLSINSNNRASINYRGNVAEIKTK